MLTVDELLRPAVATRSGDGTGCRAARDPRLPTGPDRVRADAARFARRRRHRPCRQPDRWRRFGPRRRRTVGADADAAALNRAGTARPSDLPAQPRPSTCPQIAASCGRLPRRRVTASSLAPLRGSSACRRPRSPPRWKRPPAGPAAAPIGNGPLPRALLRPSFRTSPPPVPWCQPRRGDDRPRSDPVPSGSRLRPAFSNDDVLTCVTAGTPLVGGARGVGERVRTADVRLFRGPDKVVPWSPVQSENRLHTELCTTRTIADAIHQDLRGFRQCSAASAPDTTDCPDGAGGCAVVMIRTGNTQVPRRPVVIGKRAARIAGTMPPMTPRAMAHPRPSRIDPGGTWNAKANWDPAAGSSVHAV